MWPKPKASEAALRRDPDAEVAALWLEWQHAETQLIAFLDEVGATEDAHTVAVRILPKRISSARSFAAELAPLTRADGAWQFVTTRAGDGSQMGFAMPVAEVSDDPLAFLFTEAHTLLVVWWLNSVWRVRQLATASSRLAASDAQIAASACVRPLVETAAATWVDGRTIANAWSDIKKAGVPSTGPEANDRRVALLQVLTHAMMGAKFDDRATSLKATWGRFERTNVLGQVEKLAKVAPGDLEADYQWLCNTVHPSLGNFLVFSAPPFMHATQTHIIQWFAGKPIQIQSARGSDAERTVALAMARAAATSLRSLRITLDAALHVIDDVALTTGAPRFARQPYWRNVTRPSPYEPCPCRSGKKAKRCVHEWGLEGPAMERPF
jgi:hypothetical protein